MLEILVEREAHAERPKAVAEVVVDEKVIALNV